MLFIFRGLAILFWLIITVHITGITAITDNLSLTLSMTLGAFLGSATPVGGGVVAFPVLTLLKNVPAREAAVFSLAMQSFGMTAASIAILTRRIKINGYLIFWCVLLGVSGYLIALKYISMPFTSGGMKIFFASFWLAFGVAIYILKKDRQDAGLRKDNIRLSCKFVTFLVFSFCGGIITSWMGNGIDVVFFCSAIILYSEKESVATPSAVIVMALMSVFSTIINIKTGQFTLHTLNYLAATIPIVIFFAPLGILIATRKGDIFIRKLLLLIVIVQYAMTAIIYFNNIAYILFSLLIVVCSLAVLNYMWHLNQREIK